MVILGRRLVVLVVVRIDNVVILGRRLVVVVEVGIVTMW